MDMLHGGEDRYYNGELFAMTTADGIRTQWATGKDEKKAYIALGCEDAIRFTIEVPNEESHLKIVRHPRFKSLYYFRL